MLYRHFVKQSTWRECSNFAALCQTFDAVSMDALLAGRDFGLSPAG